MAHELESKRPAWVRLGQRIGLLLPPEVHAAHHRTYDDGFPILNGITLNFVRGLRRVMPDPRAWLALFAVLSLADVYVLTHVFCRMLKVPLYAGDAVPAWPEWATAAAAWAQALVVRA